MKLEKIIQKCLKEESKAQYEMYSMLFSRFLSLCMRYRKDRDAAVTSFNNAFIKVLDNLQKVNDVDSFYGWVKRIIINQMLTEIKKENIERDRQTSVEAIDFQPSLAVSNEGSEKLNAEYLFQLLAGLPKTTGIVFNLFAIDGYSHKEIAEMLGISTGTTKWHVAEARKSLKTILNNQEENEIKEIQKCS